MKIGIIGTGSIALEHTKAISKLEECELVAVLSRDEHRANEFIKTTNSPNAKAYTSIEQFVSEAALDLVIICSPDKLHFEHAKACLSNDINVLLEKPLTTDLEKAKELINIAKKNDLILATGFHLRSHVGHRLLKEKINNANEPIRHMRIIWAIKKDDDSDWRAHDEVGKWWSLGAVGCHCIDLSRWFCNNFEEFNEFKNIFSFEKFSSNHDETAIIAAKFNNGTTVEISSSVQFGPYSRIEIFTDNNTYICENTLGREGSGKILVNNLELQYNIKSPFEEQLINIKNAIENASELFADGACGMVNVKDLVLTKK